MIDHGRDESFGLTEVGRVLRTGGRLVVVKDSGVPDEGESARALTDILDTAGFRVTDKRRIDGEGVSFAMWVASVSG